jgi:hypothetical protein
MPHLMNERKAQQASLQRLAAQRPVCIWYGGGFFLAQARIFNAISEPDGMKGLLSRR